MLRRPVVRIAATIVAVVVLSGAGCTERQQAAFHALFAQDRATAERVLADYEATRAAVTAGLPCPEWYDSAADAGWPADKWDTLSQVMFAESTCQEGARSRAGAIGLVQVMPFWAARCGLVVADLYRAVANLTCALVVLAEQGWGAWDVYRSEWGS